MCWQSKTFANKLLSEFFFLYSPKGKQILNISVPILFSYRTARVHLVDTVKI